MRALLKKRYSLYYYVFMILSSDIFFLYMDREYVVNVLKKNPTVKIAI